MEVVLGYTPMTNQQRLDQRYHDKEREYVLKLMRMCYEKFGNPLVPELLETWNAGTGIHLHSIINYAV